MTINTWPTFTLEAAFGYGPFPSPLPTTVPAGTTSVIPAATVSSYKSLILDGQIQVDGELILDTTVVPTVNYVTIPTSDILSVEFTEGRQKGLDDFPPATATVVLKNDLRQYDPDNTLGPNAGNLLPQVPIRFTVNYGGSSYQQFTMYVDDGWEQIFDHPEQGQCRLRLLDLMGEMQGITYADSAYRTQILSGSPAVYWQLDEPVGVTVMADSSGNKRDGVYSEATLGQAGLIFGSSGAVKFNNASAAAALYTGQLVTGTSMTFEAWINVPLVTPTPATRGIFRATHTPGTVTQAIAAELDVNGFINITLVSNSATSIQKFRGQTNIADGNKHHIRITQQSAGAVIYVDGVLEQPVGIILTGTPAPPDYTNITRFAIGGGLSGAAGDSLGGTLDEAAIYDGTVAVESHFAFGNTSWAGDHTGERAARVAAIAGLPASSYNFAVGKTILGPADASSGNVLDYLRKLARTEQGGLLTAGYDQGKLLFLDRYHLYTDTRSTTPQATITDDPAAVGAIRFEGSPVLEPNGMSGIINQATVTWDGGSITETALASYGPRGVNVDTLAPSAALARGIGQWIVAANKTPTTKIRSLTILPSADANAWAFAVGARISDRLTLWYQPLATGSVTTRDYWIEGRTVHIEGRKLYSVTFVLSPVFTQPWFTWDVSTWGVSTNWAY